MTIHYNICELTDYISWPYFYHSWGMSGKDGPERERLREEALALARSWDGRYKVHAKVLIADANSDGDDIVLSDRTRLPMLRQQGIAACGQPNLCLADFVRPLSQGVADRVGFFATSVDAAMVSRCSCDCYDKMLAQTVADRLAEAAAEKLHHYVRTQYWGYAPDEALSIADMLAGRYQGIRPAAGYPSLPDMSINFVIDKVLGMGEIGIRLTESGMMQPHASVSGLMFAHPQARYFDVGSIGKDQLSDYARRRGLPLELVSRFLRRNY